MVLTTFRISGLVVWFIHYIVLLIKFEDTVSEVYLIYRTCIEISSLLSSGGCLTLIEH
jgi:hypothetical protein